MLAKSQLPTRVIPVASGSLKQTIQVVTANNAQLRQAMPIQGKPIVSAVRRSPGPGSSPGPGPGSTTSGPTTGAGVSPNVGAASSSTVPNLASSPGLGQVRLQTITHSQQMQKQQTQQQQQSQQDAQPK